ncbi:preprotein translocase subunit YajC [Miniphocaeibacter massiliensis]|uniref:preprotein translocase subunit YajC n=1 Tax=Miniphocaeibacter massiliensis TaxID=2041841 RepID=UPI000C1BAB63|nr:preprotein translocase subunit YajC [Miniphocaeibacter massiliensis]
MWNYILGSSIALIGLIVLILLIYYIASRANVSKRKKFFEELHNNLKIGDEVVFSNGIYGKIKHISEDFADIEVKSGAVVKVSRYAISDIIK